MKINAKIKNIIIGMIIIVLVVIVVIGFFNSKIEHIEDANGAEDYSLAVIADDNIINRDIGSTGLVESYSNLTNTTEYSSKKYTGVDEIYGVNITTTRFEITVNHARVDKGNLKIVLLVDDEIVHVFKLNELSQTYVLENVSGYVSLRIAGESASFMFDYYVE